MAARLNYKGFEVSSFHSYKQKKYKIEGLQKRGIYNTVILEARSMIPKLNF